MAIYDIDIPKEERKPKEEDDKKDSSFSSGFKFAAGAILLIVLFFSFCSPQIIIKPVDSEGNIVTSTNGNSDNSPTAVSQNNYEDYFIKDSETSSEPNYSYDVLSILASDYEKREVDCYTENISKLSLSDKLEETIITENFLLAPTYQWYPQLNEGRFAFINLALKNDGCAKITPNVKTFIFDNEGSLIFKSKVIDSGYLAENSLRDDMELYPGDEYYTFANVDFPLDGGNTFEIPKIVVSKNSDYYLFLLFTDEKKKEVVGVYKFKILKQ